MNYLFDDCSEALLKIKQAFRSTAVDLPPEESTAPYHSITLPETFDLDDFELPDNEMLQGLVPTCLKWHFEVVIDLNIILLTNDIFAGTMLIIMSVQENRLRSKIPWMVWFTQHLSLDWMVSILRFVSYMYAWCYSNQIRVASDEFQELVISILFELERNNSLFFSSFPSDVESSTKLVFLFQFLSLSSLIDFSSFYFRCFTRALCPFLLSVFPNKSCPLEIKYTADCKLTLF